MLVTNDDGIGSIGIRTLAGVAVEHGLDVVVAAPAEEASGSSASLAAVEEDGRIVVDSRSIDGLPGVPAFGVAASPAFIAQLAADGAFGPPPELVLSGVNWGANAGRAVLHSGTVGAAMTAAIRGGRAMAVSLDILSAADAATASGGAAAIPRTEADDAPGARRRRWDTPSRIALELLPALLAAPAGTVFNINAPDVPRQELRGIRRATLASFGQVQMKVIETGDGFVRTGLEELTDRPEPGTDLALLADGYATVTALRPYAELPDVDIPQAPLATNQWSPAPTT